MLEGHIDALMSADYSPVTRKRMTSESWRRDRGRKP